MCMRVCSLICLTLTIATPGLSSQEKEPPLLLQRPSLSTDRIVFVFAGDLWTVARSGGDAHRLTDTPFLETNPAFAPDGSQIAFTGERDGNLDVYVLPATGGTPRRLTFHPARDEVVGWTPDGARILFASGRSRNHGGNQSTMRLFTVVAAGGFPEEVPLPVAGDGSFSPDGARIAFVKQLNNSLNTHKRYRGGTTRRIWLANLSDSSTAPIPRDNSNDFRPMWTGDALYFLSDRNGPTSLFRYDQGSKRVTQLVENRGFDMKWASAGPGAIVYEQFGSLHLYHLRTGKTQPVPVRLAGDLPEVKPRLVNVSRQLRLNQARLSPDGAHVLVEARGEILTIPAEKGESRNITNTPGVAERDPAWSPDGKRIAYFSDESGEYELHIRDHSGGVVERIRLGAKPAFYQSPVWSPDAKKLAYLDNHLGLWYLDIAAKRPVLVDRDHYQWESNPAAAWSPDSEWLAYRKQLPSGLGAVFLYSLANAKPVQVTDGMSDCATPVFDRQGKYLYFLASTDSGPSREIDVLKTTRRVTSGVYLTVLSRHEPSPLGPGRSEGATGVEPHVRVDLEDIGRRAIPLPMPPRRYTALEVGKAGVVFVAERVEGTRPAEAGVTIHRFDLSRRQAGVFISGARGFQIAANGERVLYRQGSQLLVASSLDGGSKIPLKTDDLEVRSDPKAEWRQIYREAWRLVRDFFYDRNYHGLDLKATAKRYEPFLDRLASRRDLNYLIAEMVGELSVGHISVWGGDDSPPGNPPPTGLLGADYRIENGRYRIVKVYRGENWNPEALAPLTQPGINVSAGEYLLAVNERELRAEDNIYSAFAGLAGKAAVLRVASTPDGGDAREVTVVPIASETWLRALEWVEQNRREVARRTNGRVAYIYLPNTADEGARRFLREFYAQSRKEAAIIDERFNGGGEHATDIVEYLVRKPMNFTTTRDGADFPQPTGVIAGPKVMIINEFSGSGGDLLPWYFRRARAGTLVGKRTWGGVVGLWDRTPPLLDGGALVIPSGLSWNPDGKWDLENVGVPPDIEVEQDPQLVRQGRDPQLEKAIEVVLNEMKEHPPTKPKRPTYPGWNDRNAKR